MVTRMLEHTRSLNGEDTNSVSSFLPIAPFVKYWQVILQKEIRLIIYWLVLIVFELISNPIEADISTIPVK